MFKKDITIAIVSLVASLAAVLVLAVLMAPTAEGSDMNKSKYRGKWFDPALADCREAIMQRESKLD